MDPWTRVDDAGVSSTPEDVSDFFNEDPSFGTGTWHTSGGAFPVDQSLFNASGTMTYQRANQTPSWNGISNPSGADTYQQDVADFGLLNNGPHGMLVAQPLELTEVVHAPEICGYTPKQTDNRYPPATGGNNSQRTHQNTLLTEPSSDYVNPGLSINELGDAPHLPFKGNGPRSTRDTKNTLVEKKKARTTNGIYR